MTLPKTERIVKKKTLAEELGEMGVRQFVRTTMIEAFKQYAGTGKEADEMIEEINSKLLEDFRTIAQDESSKLIKQIEVTFKSL